MTIRPATEADVPAIVAMGLRFQALTTYAHHLRTDAALLTTLADGLVRNEDAVIFVADRAGVLIGMLAAALYPQPMSGLLIGAEVCWWMEPEARGGRTALRLLHTAEAWAKAHGAAVFQMIAPTDHVAQFYDRLGFERVEIHYQRAL